jgi:hypothetical protein
MSYLSVEPREDFEEDEFEIAGPLRKHTLGYVVHSFVLVHNG